MPATEVSHLVWHECLRCGQLITLYDDGIYRHQHPGADHLGVPPPEVRDERAVPVFFVGRTR